MFRIWWLKQWRAERAGRRDGQWILNMSRGTQPTPWLLDLMAEWAGERDGQISRFADDQQRNAGKVVQVPVMADAARGVADADEKRRALAEAGMRERVRLDLAAFNHRLRQRLSPYTRTAARYRRGVFLSVALEIDIPATLLQFPGLGEDGEMDDDAQSALPLPSRSRGPMGFAPSGKKFDGGKEKETNNA
jgi:hypothetical protein